MISAKEIIESLDKLLPYLKLLWWTNTIIILLPKQVSDFLGLTGFRDEFMQYMSIFFIFGLVSFVLEKVQKAREGFAAKQKEKVEKDLLEERKTDIVRSITTLPQEELVILVYAFYYSKKTIYPPIHDPRISSLRSKGLLTTSTTMGNPASWPHHVPEFVWDYLEGNKDKFLIGEDDPRYYDFQQIMRNTNYEMRRFP